MRNLIIIAFISLSTISWSQKENFSAQTLEKFANAYKEVRNENMTFQLNMVSAIEDAGLTNDEFTDIHELINNPNAEKKPTTAQKRQYNLALKNIQNLKKDIQESMERLIEKNGLKLETYQAIAKASQSDKALNEKIQKLIK
ncbi:DUF4168 domain-containing protein [Flavobacteriaceae bacterium 14752]|uniref:DUF4168 domain-containing protein n=1 Tax=Mesohalobacter salilacus TaxID=2491711 RepID=UPI000F643575|nr:DUF4168 domain-containing protein [Flavobacteriaceae bacterium 14752]